MKTMKNLFFQTMLVLTLAITACDPTEETGFVADPSDLKGEINEDVTLDAKKTYKLTGALIVNDGASLTIPAGTVIEAKGGQISYIAVAQGGKIFANGTAEKPVVMTCDTKVSSSWGGLVICGKAPTNKSDAGSAGAEVSGLPYGGTDVNDNSGVLKYLRVEYTGFAYSDSKEFNGISFFGVGAGTTVDYVVSYKGGDDGIEFFGGTVNASHLVSVDSEDDGIDFADGWSGTGEYWFSMNSKKSGIEGSNNGDNGAATPMTDAKLKNLTVYGMGEKPFFIKEGAGKMTIDNIVIGGLVASKAQSYFYAESSDADAAARIAAGDIKITNVKFEGSLASGQSKAVSGLSFTENSNATGAGTGINKPTWLPDALNMVASGIYVVE